MPKSLPTSMEKYLGDLSKESPEKIISKIRVVLNLLVNEIVNYATPELYLTGRKSRHLFHPLINSILLEKGFHTHFLNILTGKIHGKELCIIEPVGKLSKKITLLADSINNGEEKARILSIMRNYKINIANIFCYGANTEGIKYLEENGIFSPDKIFTLNVFSPEEYREFSKRLETYYQSRIEPMDAEHVFAKFRIAKKIPREKLYLMFKKSVQSALTCTKGDFTQAKMINSSDKENANIMFTRENIVNFNFECYDHDICKKGSCSIPEDIQIEYMQIRLKAKLEETESDICIMVFCSPVDVDISISSKKNCAFKTNYCLLDTVKYDVSAFKREEIAAITCPQCIENNISLSILEKIGNQFGSLIEKVKNENKSKSKTSKN